MSRVPNRGLLLRRAQQGKLEARCWQRISEDGLDDHAGNARQDFLPVQIIESHDQIQPGRINLRESQFRTKSGCTWRHPHTDTIILSIHNNLSYEVRVVE